jgi:hypothetical protein
MAGLCNLTLKAGNSSNSSLLSPSMSLTDISVSGMVKVDDILMV